MSKYQALDLTLSTCLSCCFSSQKMATSPFQILRPKTWKHFSLLSSLIPYVHCFREFCWLYLSKYIQSPPTSHHLHYVHTGPGLFFFFGCAGSWLLQGLFSSCREQGLFSSGSVWASHCSGFSWCEAWALGARASVLGAHGLPSCSSWALEHRLNSHGT